MTASSRDELPAMCRMAAFARKHEVAGCVRYVDRHSKACAGTKRRERCAHDRLPAAYLKELVTGKAGQGPRNRFKIIDQTHGGKSVGSAQLGGIDHPGIVGESAAAVLDRAGDGQNCGADRAGFRQIAKICVERLAKAAVVADSHMGNRAHGSAGQERKARVGAADVRKQDLLNGWRWGGCIHRCRAVLIRSAYQRNDDFGMRRSDG